MNRVITIGRAEDNQIVVAKQTVNKYHAQLTVENNQVFIEDLNSLNGTYVNGIRISQKKMIKTPDQLTLADNVLIDWSIITSDNIEEVKTTEDTTGPVEAQSSKEKKDPKTPTKNKKEPKSKTSNGEWNWKQIGQKIKSAFTFQNILNFLKANWDLILIYGSILLMIVLLQEFIS